jgi:hypothetical protein
MAANLPDINAWILPYQDEPPNSTYFDPSSCFQTAKAIYPFVDMLFICFAEIVPAANPSTYTIQIQNRQHGTPPDTFSNQQYMAQIIADARASNPNIKIGITLDYNTPITIQQMLGDRPDLAAAAFAANLLAFLTLNDLDGLDIDWEIPLSDTSQQLFAVLLEAIGTAFRAAPKKLYLTISPNTSNNLDPSAVNANVDFLNLQIYGGALPSQFQGITVPMAYGVNSEGGETAQSAFDTAGSLGLSLFTNWRLNSGNFPFEQQQQQALYELAAGTPPSA